MSIQLHIKEARAFLKYINHADIVALVRDINDHEADFTYIKVSLINCLNKQLAKLPVRNDSLDQKIKEVFCLMVNNAETGIYLYGARITLLKLDDEPKPKRHEPPRIPSLTPIAKLAFKEWEQECHSPSLPAMPAQGKPVFKPEIIDTVFSLLKDYFAPEEQNELLLILKTGGTANTKLLFNDNGNRLADVFKQLYEHGYIVGCRKQELNRWIMDCFCYLSRNATKAFTADYVEKCVSKNNNPCMNPVIQIVDGEIRQAEAS